MSETSYRKWGETLNQHSFSKHIKLKLEAMWVQIELFIICISLVLHFLWPKPSNVSLFPIRCFEIHVMSTLIHIIWRSGVLGRSTITCPEPIIIWLIITIVKATGTKIKIALVDNGSWRLRSWRSINNTNLNFKTFIIFDLIGFECQGRLNK